MSFKWAIRSLVVVILIVCGLGELQRTPQDPGIYKRGIVLPANPPKDNKGNPLAGYHLEYIPITEQP